MSYEESLRSITLDADSSIGFYTGVPNLPGSATPNYGKQYCFVKVVGAHQAGLATGTDIIAGVLQNKPQQAGAAATVAIAGVSNVMAGAAVNAGDEVGPDAEGRAVAGTGGGVALGTSSGAGELIPVLLK